MRLSIFLFTLGTLLPKISWQQAIFPATGIVFNENVTARIDIRIHPDSLAEMLKEENLYSDHEYPADFYWSDGIRQDTVKKVGFRLRGNTSRKSAKKSFKVKFNHFSEKNFHGLSDLNLNGEHNDPTIARAKLCWELMKLADLEAPRSNHIALYVNDEYKGLYLNVEHIDNDYLESRGKNPEGQLFKCFYGCDFRYEGDAPSQYNWSVYAPQNNEENPDYKTLISFFKALNAPVDGSYRCNLEKVFDVDAYLRRMAMEVLLGHWDNPIFNKNNAYIYINPDTKKAELLSYDIDNTFGIDWFQVNWADRNVYSWAPSNQARPIYTQLLAVPEYKKRYGYYISKFCSSFFNPVYLSPILQQLKNKISPFRLGDVYASYDYGYSYDDFLRAFDTGLGAHVKYGLSDYISRRSTTALNQIQNAQIAPVIEYVSVVNNGSSMNVRCRISSLNTVQVALDYRPAGKSWMQATFADNGIFPDQNAGDGWYSCLIPISEKQNMDLVVNARDASLRSSTWPVCGSYSVSVGYEEVPPLRINEWMADNTTVTDPAGEYDDWIEIYNASASDVSLSERYLTDDASVRDKWPLPPVNMAPGDFLLIWADEDQQQGNNHANFKLAKTGEFIGIFDTKENHFAPIDTLSFANMPANKTFGRLPDGTGNVQTLTTVSPGRSNAPSSGSGVLHHSTALQCTSPCSDECILRGVITGDMIEIFHSSGHTFWKYLSSSDEEIALDVSSWPSGYYQIVLKRGNRYISRQMIKL